MKWFRSIFFAMYVYTITATEIEMDDLWDGDDSGNMLAAGCHVVDIDAVGKFLVVGCPQRNEKVGEVRTYVKTNGEWIRDEEPLTPPVNDGAAQFGYSLDLSEEDDDGNLRLIVGAPYDTDMSGSVWFFTREDGVWKYSQRMQPTDMADYIMLGFSVAISSDGYIAAAGGILDGDAVGGVWVYRYSASSRDYEMANKILPNTVVGEAQFGSSLSIGNAGATIAVGGRHDASNVGSAWVISSADEWETYTDEKLAGTEYELANPVKGIAQGYSIAINEAGTTVYSGGPYDDNGQGAVWVFTKKSDNTWSQTNIIRVDDNLGDTRFGISVYLSPGDEYLVVGGPYDDNAVGAIWLFKTKNTDYRLKLVSVDRNGDGHQGVSVAASQGCGHIVLGGNFDASGFGATWLWTKEKPEPPDDAPTGVPSRAPVENNDKKPKPNKPKNKPEPTPSKPKKPKADKPKNKK